MSSTLGQPGFTASNRAGQSGVSEGNVGSLGSGVLQTIEEGAGAQLADVFYYDKSVAYYQLPSVQRSRGDDVRTLNITSFGSRGTVTLPRKFLNFGPACLEFKLPIEYAWSGCEYVLNFYKSNVELDAIAMGGVPAGVTAITANGIATMQRTFIAGSQANSNTFMFESSGCDTMLPTSFQSGGMAFAFPQQIELNMGGGGLIQFDRYSNWVAIMASCPFTEQRKDLMRMAGGGLCLDTEEEAKTMPVKWGLKTWCTAAGTTNIHNTRVKANTAADGQAGNGEIIIVDSEHTKKKLVPIEWNVILPIKTPETNFMYALERRKPLDTSCFSSDFQMTFTWSNFHEWSDTGKGYPNAPVYYGQRVKSAADLAVGVGVAASATLSSTKGLLGPYTVGAALGYTSVIPDGSAEKHSFGGELGSPTLVSLSINPSAPTVIGSAANVASECAFRLNNVITCAPVVWTNHYRVASGAVVVNGVHCFDANVRDRHFTTAAGAVIGGQNPGRPRYPQSIRYINANDNFICSQQMPADVVNSGITYPSRFTEINYINSSLKLTNPALGAYNALRVSKEAVLYYPFQYFYSQVYRIVSNPWANLKSLTNTSVSSDEFKNKLADVTSQTCKITQMIQMPANPCTALFVTVFREKDRQTNTVNRMNSYNPVLFWNALNPIRMDLKDGGNTLFSYSNKNDFEFYSLADRPSALKVPFRGGHVKVMPKNVYGNRYISNPLSQGTAPLMGAAGDYIVAGLAGTGLIANTPLTPFWGNSKTGDSLNVGVGFQGLYEGNATKSAPATSANSFNADDLCNSVCVRNGLRSGGGSTPCHTTDWYEAAIIEFPFVMAEPITSEKIVQQTPTFARTQLQLDFWIDPFMKLDNGFDDMYDRTYGLTRPCPTGVPVVDGGPNNLVRTTLASQVPAYTYGGPLSHPVPDCLHEGGCDPLSDALAFRDTYTATGPSGRTPAGTGPSLLLSRESCYADAFLFDDCNSWNINNGVLMLVVNFSQNQVWTISPLRTSLLQARG